MATIFPIYFHGHLPHSQDLAIHRLLTLIPDRIDQNIKFSIPKYKMVDRKQVIEYR